MQILPPYPQISEQSNVQDCSSRPRHGTEIKGNNQESPFLPALPPSAKASQKDASADNKNIQRSSLLLIKLHHKKYLSETRN